MALAEVSGIVDGPLKAWAPTNLVASRDRVSILTSLVSQTQAGYEVAEGIKSGGDLGSPG